MEQDKQALEAAQAYFIARIEMAQPEPDERLFIALGQVAYEQFKLEEK